MRALSRGNHSWVKTTGYGRSCYHGGLPVWLRGLLVLAAGGAVLLCGQHVAEEYGATMSYRDASLCEAGNRMGNGGDGEACVRREIATVLDRGRGQNCTTTNDTDGAATGGSITTCSTVYSVKVKWLDRTAWLDVWSETYNEVTAGDPTEVRLWRGEVVGLKVLGHTYSYEPSSQSGVGLWLALGVLLVAVCAWALASGKLSGLFAFHNFGWLLLAPGLGWLGSMALFGGNPFAWGFAIVWVGFVVFWIVGARQM